ncbi:hypothetical protein ZIOFF_049209 [Zingiber officinale]|uniref:DUF4216 domain-containing protein n=1 Tax=Zingiber officinale TaxID=94328 RepID=A0A8J5FWI9_ZINOF|nr:hypothetical protein ZIOFF_049209 [Zingiber officinale]
MDSGLQTSLEHIPIMTNHIPMAQETLVEAFGMPEGLFTSNENYSGASTSHMPMESNVDRTNDRIDDLDLRVLSCGPNPVAFSYHGFNINGFAFRTVESESNKKVQNSGVMVQSIHDNDDHESNYYGRLIDVISLEYGGLGRIFLFRCDWVNITTGMKVDPLGFTMVNFSYLIHTGEREEHEPFILASQAQMVYYVRDPKEDEWYCVIRHTPRDTYNMGEEDDIDTMQFTPNNFSNMQSLLGDVNGVDVDLIRTDVRDQNEEFTEEMLTSQRQQNRRGRTVMRDVHALDPDDVLVVQFNERGQPYGDIQPVLANFVGTIARNGNLLPLSFLDWRKMPKKRLNDAWRKVTARFDIPDRHRDVIMQMMGAAWRRWRTEIKAKSYDSNIPLDELVSIRPVPQKLTPEVWEALCHYWNTNEALLDEAVRRRLQDKPEGTQPTEVHEDAFRDVFGPEHSGRVQCLGAGALPSQVFPELCKRTIYTPSYHSNSNMTAEFKEMQEKIKEMEAREVQRRIETEQMIRQMHDQQLQNFAHIMQSMISGAVGGSCGPELLLAQMAAIMAEIMQRNIDAPPNAKGNDPTPPPPTDPSNN